VKHLRVGILALQGDVQAHARALRGVGAQPVCMRTPADLEDLAALILPGGESTTISKGLKREGLTDPIRAFARSGKPVLGTCAGAILLAAKAKNHQVPVLGLMDFSALRNAYGTQLDSFIAELDDGADPSVEGFRAVFIRAPQFTDLGTAVQVLAQVDSHPVLLRQSNLWAAAFHPELTPDLRLHRAFLSTVQPGHSPE